MQVLYTKDDPSEQIAGIFLRNTILMLMIEYNKKFIVGKIEKCALKI